MFNTFFAPVCIACNTESGRVTPAGLCAPCELARSIVTPGVCPGCGADAAPHRVYCGNACRDAADFYSDF